MKVDDRKQPIRVYAGWRIYDNGPNYHPVTGRFQSVSTRRKDRREY